MNRKNLIQRVEIAEQYIRENLDGDLSLNRIAEVACLSPYHWHRVYQGIRGETVFSFISRQRGYQYATSISSTSKPLNSIARSFGRSPSSFTRSFHRMYSECPIQFRERRMPSNMGENICQSIQDKKIVHRNRKWLAYLPHQGSYNEIEFTFNKLVDRLGTLSGNVAPSQPKLCGLFFSDPSTTPRDKLRSIAGCIVSEKQPLPGNVKKFLVKGGTFLSLRYEGCYTDLELVYSWVFSNWLPMTDFIPAHYPIVEEYINSPKNTPPSQLITDIYIQVSPSSY